MLRIGLPAPASPKSWRTVYPDRGRIESPFAGFAQRDRGDRADCIGFREDVRLNGSAQAVRSAKPFS